MQFIVGLTGGIGSGKTVASDWFAQQGIVIVDADVVAHQVVAAGQPLLAQIQQHFGAWVINQAGELDRRALREHIFNDPSAKQQLEAITHPAIRAEILKQLQAAQSPYVILVSPLLFETGQHQLTQRNVLIDATTELQRQRASQRDQQSHAQIEKIIATQMPRQHKQQHADDIVLNDGDLSHLYQQLATLHQQYLQYAQQATQPPQ
ncbi:dephospho-CoA kinase [Acinetobacter larvae]|uniref:Dephospho-CoA kinase n=1 Tax=Acinetobacter larvae TaxID=1789224 RepID=A0A1B2LVV6_9GAMM|nr:dephospho-CoA kinase [Acinetobacter larvae]AOA57067.1 dephospho-CoA kinase [Acinetobacter larvae]